jgi:hypothetical protein
LGHDTEIYRKNNTEIPVLELNKYVAIDTITNYQALMSAKAWIFCEKQLVEVDPFVLKNWQAVVF